MKVIVKNGDDVVGAVELAGGKIQIAAHTISHDESTGMFNLSRGCAVTVTQSDGRKIRFAGTTAQVRAPEIELMVDGGYPSDVPYPTIGILADAIKSNPQISLFRLEWGVSVGGWASEGASLYDKKKHTLREYAVSGDEFSRFCKKVLYTGVSEAVLAQEAQSEKRAQERNSDRVYAQPLSFGFLTNYGAVRKEIQ
ncbi:MAG TPA: hypothetical protein VF719_10585 [Abditibacteriaceae bacterium]